MLISPVNHEEFQSRHKERGEGWAILFLFEMVQTLALQLNNIMSDQKSLAADLRAVVTELQKSKAEIVFVQAAVATLTQKVADLQAIIDAGGSAVSQELIDAVAAVQTAAADVDNQIPDLPPPTPNAPVITSALTASASVGQPFSYQITADSTPTSFDAAPLPDGLAVDANGLITGAPTAAGESTIGLTATNAAGVGQASLVLTVS